MKETARYYLKLLALPLFLLVISLSLRLLWSLFTLPSAPELADEVAGWLTKYGLPILFLCAMAEGMLLVGGYFPGVFVIAVSVLVARNWYEAAIAIAVGSAGLMTAHVINYQLGRHGWYRILARFGLTGAIKDAKERLEKRGPVAVFTTYWAPSIAAMTDTAAGIMKIPFWKFFLYALLASTFWNILAGTIMYQLGDRALELASPDSTGIWLVPSILIAWMVVLVGWDSLKVRNSRNPQ